jgi:hypothetical protein
MKNNKERKINIIKALKRENAFLKRQPIEPLRIYETNLKHQRASYCLASDFRMLHGEKIARDIAKNGICDRIRDFLDVHDIKSIDEGYVTTYFFDFWTE